MAMADAMRERQEGEQELAQVQAALAEHRQRIGALKQETEASLATAQKVEGAADAKERVFMEVRPAKPAPAHMASCPHLGIGMLTSLAVLGWSILA